MDPTSPELAKLLQGMILRPDQVEHLEVRLREVPADRDARAQVVGSCIRLRFESRQAADTLTRHVLWFIRHAPAEPVLRTPFAAVESPEAEEAWTAQLARHPSDAAVLAGASHFFADRDAPLAASLLARAKALEPSGDWEWTYVPPGHEPKSPGALEAELEAEGDERRRFYLLTDLLRASGEAGDAERTRRYAQTLLDLSPRFPNDWNYGNGLHAGHSALGLLALDSGDVAEAVRRLLASGETPGSPQLDTFGPGFELARRLLAQGEREAVRGYLERCGRFWEMGRAKLDTWLQALAAGQTPDLRRLP